MKRRQPSNEILCRPAYYLAFVVMILVTAACSQFVPMPTPIPTATVSPVPPTDNPEPLAARVNGQTILLGEYEKEVKRCQAGKTDGANCPVIVLQNLIEQKVVEQAALTNGVVVSD